MPEAAQPDSTPDAFLALERAGAFLRAAGLHFDSVAATEVRGHVEVTAEHHTPWGITHGGLYTTVIESVASVGASVAVESRGQFAVGVGNQTDFLRSHVTGRLDVVGTPIQQGRSLQLWLVEISDEAGKPIARGQVRLFNRDLPGH
ncbi:PaaI family thioesterase [Streptomyces sp. NPDC058691]|uniref:PaaI family thioesterase n=1 Tax=Streptomyces sp. NPDC058691 TaxID=3346601 RepID=UPI0036698DCF